MPNETQATSGAQPRADLVTVTGCLRAGNAEDTFVLTTSSQAGEPKAATYQLMSPPAVSLVEHVGERVEVSGTVRTAQDIDSRSRDVQEPRGTAGRPVVETKSELDIKTLDVSSVKTLTKTCEG